MKPFTFEREARWMIWLFLVPSTVAVAAAYAVPWFLRLFGVE